MKEAIQFLKGDSGKKGKWKESLCLREGCKKKLDFFFFFNWPIFIKMCEIIGFSSLERVHI